MPSLRAPRRLRRLATLCGFAAVALVAACGGGELVSAFNPQRIVSFGDEASVITPEGRKYTVNALDATTKALDCASNPNWVQYLSQSFGLLFPQCNPNNVSAPSVMRATAGAKVADLVTQVDAQLADATASGGFDANTLVTVMVGANDVLEQYDAFKAAGGQDASPQIAELEARGDLLAEQVKRIAAAGGKVVVTTVLDLGVTPFAAAEVAAHPEFSTDAATVLTLLTARLNARLRVGLRDASGREIGLLLGDELVETLVKFPSVAGLANITDPACTVALPDCTTDTLDTAKSADASTWLWATNIQLSAGGHRQLGAAAVSRARNNPF